MLDRQTADVERQKWE